MRKLVRIVRIARVVDLAEDGQLSVVEMEGLGWRVVVERGLFHAGERAVYCEIDSALPAEDPRFASLRADSLVTWRRDGRIAASVLRVRTRKIRGVVSQGVLLPFASFPELAGCEVGDEVTDRLGVVRYEALAASFCRTRGGEVGGTASRGDFPAFIPRTDEERIQNRPDLFDAMKGRLFEVTAKDDGASMTVYYAPSRHARHPFRVCSRNRDLCPLRESRFWQLAWREDLERRIRSTGRELAFQGEFVGPGVNGNHDLYARDEWHVFHVWDIDGGRYLEAFERRALCQALGLAHVQVVEEACAVFDRYPTLQSLLAMAEGKTARGHEREGLVCKETGTPSPVTFKIVSNRYLLKFG